MSNEKSFKKVSSKKYQIEVDGEYVTINVPFAKVEKLVEEFFSRGGAVSPEGEVLTDIPVLIRSFGALGDVLISEYDSKGNLVEDKGCRDMANEEVIALFQVATDVITNFIEVIAGHKEQEEAPAVTEKAETKTME